MSEMVTKIGSLQKIEIQDNLENTCKMICNNMDRHILPNNYESWIEYVRDRLYRDYVIVNDTLYKIINNIDIDEDDLFFIRKTQDNNLEYVVRYYNGSCCLSEALEKALNNM